MPFFHIIIVVDIIILRCLRRLADITPHAPLDVIYFAITLFAYFQLLRHYATICFV